MLGTGSTIIACLRSARHSLGIELNPTYAEIARTLIEEERAALGDSAANLDARVITGDASLLEELSIPLVDYVFTSPPYWNMLRSRGAQTQKNRRSQPTLDVAYSDDPADLGNIDNYTEFLDRVVAIYTNLQDYLRPKAYLTIIVKNIKKGGKIYPLAWDLGRLLGKTYTLKDEKIWCQDDIRLAPYGMGNAWVSNTFHHYCLQFRYEPEL